MSDLMRCPFCGGIDIWPEMGTPPPYGLECRGCGASSWQASWSEPDEAIAAWNTRSPRAAAEALLADDIPPKALAAAWQEFKRAGNGPVGPGPGFKEALRAALRAIAEG